MSTALCSDHPDSITLPAHEIIPPCANCGARIIRDQILIFKREIRIGSHRSRVYPYKEPRRLLTFGHFSEKKWKSVPFIKQACEIHPDGLCTRSWDVPSNKVHRFSQGPCYKGWNLESYVSGAFLHFKRESTGRSYGNFPCSTIPISQ